MFLVKPDVRFPCSVFICLRVYATCADIYVSYIYMVNDFFKKENKQKQRGEHVHAVDVFQSCMLHAAVRVEWVGNLHPNVFV